MNEVKSSKRIYVLNELQWLAIYAISKQSKRFTDAVLIRLFLYIQDTLLHMKYQNYLAGQKVQLSFTRAHARGLGQIMS